MSNREVLAEQLNTYIAVCDVHQTRLESAAHHINTIFPLQAAELDKLNDQTISFLDQMVYRFSKLQDTIGQNICPLILKLLQEPLVSAPFIDQLNRLEQLGLMSTDHWLHMRELRNQVTHEYPEDNAKKVALLNELFGQVAMLSDQWSVLKHFILERV